MGKTSADMPPVGITWAVDDYNSQFQFRQTPTHVGSVH